MARTTKKRAQQLKHDKFRDTTMGLIDRAGDRLEGRGRTILYALAGLAAAPDGRIYFLDARRHRLLRLKTPASLP